MYSQIIQVDDDKITRTNNHPPISPCYMTYLYVEQPPTFPPPSPSFPLSVHLPTMRHVVGCMYGDVMEVNVLQETILSVKQKLLTYPPGKCYTGKLPDTGLICLWVEFGMPVEYEGQIMSQTHKLNVPFLDDMKLKDVIPFYSTDFKNWVRLAELADPVNQYSDWNKSVTCKLCFHFCDNGKQVIMPSITTLYERTNMAPTTKQQWALPQDSNILIRLMQAMDSFSMCFFMATCKQLYKIGNSAEVWRKIATEIINSSGTYKTAEERSAKRRKIAEKSVYSCKVFCLKLVLKTKMCQICDVKVEGKFAVTCSQCKTTFCRFCSGRGDFFGMWQVKEEDYGDVFICFVCAKPA